MIPKSMDGPHANNAKRHQFIGEAATLLPGQLMG
jgi:hypothetical protein